MATKVFRAKQGSNINRQSPLFRLCTERAGVEEANRIFYRAMENVASGNSINSITERDTENIERQSRNVSVQVKLLGETGARELLAKLAIWAKHNGYDLLKLTWERGVKQEFEPINQEF